MRDRAPFGSEATDAHEPSAPIEDTQSSAVNDRKQRRLARKAALREAGDNVGSRARSRWSDANYTTRTTIGFALMAVMTALVAFGVLSFVWEQHFQTYTRENIQRIATNTAAGIGSKYAQTESWYEGALSSASAASGLSDGIGVQVIDGDGNVIYDDSRVTEGGASLAPVDKDSMATATVYAEGVPVGVVHVWVYGSSTLLTQADQEFRAKSYQAMVFSTVIAVVIAVLLGYLFARGLVNPIKRIARSAKEFGDGDLTARTGMQGDDEISQLGQTFDRMAESVEKDHELERRLTSDVAHELRTPLMAIQSTVEAMVDGVFEADTERLNTVNSEVQRLSRLVDAILKLTRLENGSTELKKQVVDISQLLSDLITTHEAFVHDSGLELVYNPTRDTYIYADPDMIRQAVANLISNAVRYTPAGTITVAVEHDEENAIISVADTGIGLSEQDAKMVFSRFWRAEAGRNRESGGLGVGLSLVKEIVDQHDGTVEATGVLDEGATFTITIPLFNEERIREERSRDRRSDPVASDATADGWIDSAFEDDH